jgi:hypothetical protein
MNITQSPVLTRLEQYIATATTSGRFEADLLLIKIAKGQKAFTYLSFRFGAKLQEEISLKWSEKNKRWDVNDKDRFLSIAEDENLPLSDVTDAFLAAFDVAKDRGMIGIYLTNDGIADAVRRAKETGSSVYVNTGQVGAIGRNAKASNIQFNQINNK